MRILISTDSVGGVWDYSCTLSGALRSAGHEVLLAVLGEVEERHTSGIPAGVEVVSRPYRLEWMQDAGGDVARSGRWLARLAELWQADVAHLNQFSPVLAPFGIPTVVVAHSDVLSWFGETLHIDAPGEWRRYAMRVRRGLRRATVVVAPTEYQSRLLARHYGRGADRVIHNGVAAPAGPHAPAGAPLVVCAARAWDAAKGVGVLDEAAGVLGPSAPPIHILGSTTAPEGHRCHPRHLIVHGAVKHEEVERWLGRASIYVSPSLYEPFGLAPLEAALHGCALLLSDIGAYRELWDGCAAFFPRGDPAALARELSALVADPARVATLADSARRRALRRYTVERMTGAYLSLYSDLRAGKLSRSIRPPAPQGV